MEYLRTARAPGSTLLLGGITYRLVEVEGYGSSAIVYRAVYQDSLNQGSQHQVFLKELFPITPHGEILRDESGSILCLESGRRIMEDAQRRFRMGNQINLELLQRSPSATAGNLNSYEAFGTYYSVLSVHGGETLLSRLEARGSLPLREAAVVMLQILRALDGFHTHHLLHLDLSPDNILLLPEQAMLIDFNSVWDTCAWNGADYFFSCKPGYSAPEVLLQNAAEIGPSTDLFACCAVFFHMVTGRRLREEELQGGLRRSVAAMLQDMSHLPQTAAAKTAEILIRGLHTLPRKRYANIAALRRELEELLRRLDGCGVTLSALWEAGAAAYRSRRQSPWAYAAQPVQDKRQVLTQAELAAQLTGGARVLLSGPSGMGKTRLLEELWAAHIRQYRPDAPVFFYLSLRDFQAGGADSSFLRRSLLAALRFAPEEPGYADALHALEALFDAGGAVSLVLLLDGLNEAGAHQEPLLREIEYLANRPGVALLVTERTDAVLDYGLPGFRALTLGPLSEAQVAAQFSAYNVPLPTAASLRHLLTTPMLLFLYLESARLPAGGQTAVPETQEALLGAYLERFCRQALREDSGNQSAQLVSRYLLTHLLPEIAWEMRRLDRSTLPIETVRTLAARSYQALHSRSFGAAFQDYLGKSRLMLKDLKSSDEWYDLAIREQLLERFGLLTQTAQGQYTLLHDSFLPVLAAQAEENRLHIRQSVVKVWRRRLAVWMAVLLTALGAVTVSMRYFQSKTAYSAVEQSQIHDALTGLNAALGTWSNRISAQTQLLERAAISDVLDNQDASARQELAEQIAQKRAFLAALYSPRLEASDGLALRTIADSKPLFSVEALEALWDACLTLEPVAEAAMDHLEASLCPADSIYDTRDKRERLVNAYQTYLDAETRYVSYLLAMLLADMTPEQQAEIWSAMTYMEALDGFYDGPGSVAPERLADGRDRAWEAVKSACMEMRAQGFELSWGN